MMDLFDGFISILAILFIIVCGVAVFAIPIALFGALTYGIFILLLNPIFWTGVISLTVVLCVYNYINKWKSREF